MKIDKRICDRCKCELHKNNSRFVFNIRFEFQLNEYHYREFRELTDLCDSCAYEAINILGNHNYNWQVGTMNSKVKQLFEIP